MGASLLRQWVDRWEIHPAIAGVVERRYADGKFVEQSSLGYSEPWVAQSDFGSDYSRYLPLGIGQWRQDRPIAGAAFMAATLGFGIWHIVAIIENRELRQSGRIDELAEARMLQNVSGGLVYATLGTSVLEAILVDWLEWY